MFLLVLCDIVVGFLVFIEVASAVRTVVTGSDVGLLDVAVRGGVLVRGDATLWWGVVYRGGVVVLWGGIVVGGDVVDMEYARSVTIILLHIQHCRVS